VKVAALGMARARALDIDGPPLKRAIMGERGNPALNQTLVKRFVNLMSLLPVGNLVRLSTDELAVVTPNTRQTRFARRSRSSRVRLGEMLEEPVLANTWERDAGGHSRAVVEVVHQAPLAIDPLQFL
jgi:hypothetical protein